MFESLFSGVGDAELIPVIEQLAREEAQVAARRLAAIAELVRRGTEDDEERNRWAFDPWDNIAAQVAAALNVGHRRASGQMRIAVELRDRLPRTASIFSRGALSSRMISAITWRTHLVTDDGLLALIDDALAEAAIGWAPLSETKLNSAIDAVVERFDPEAVRRVKDVTRDRDFTIGACDDTAETATVWGRLLACDAAVMDQRLTAMAKAVCQNDPRSVGERRSDAVGALINGNEQLACRCGSPDCPTAEAAPKSKVVIRVIADPAAVEAARTMFADEHDDVAVATRSGRPDAGAALMVGRGVLPTAVLAEALRNGAKVKELRPPSAEPERGYRPSAELAEFVRMRDLFCRFPGCDVPADRCDLDHTIPWPLGPTHASNLKCGCRKHHLMKTFWGGPDGWRDDQRPDGSVLWTSPSGQAYITKPGSRLFFPSWDTSTANLPPPFGEPPPALAGTSMMPIRRRTRAADAAARVEAERALNRTSATPSEV